MTSFDVNDRRGTNRRPGVDAVGVARVPEPTPEPGDVLPKLPPKWSAPLSRMDEPTSEPSSNVDATLGTLGADKLEALRSSPLTMTREQVDELVASNDATINALARQGVVFTVGNDVVTVSNRVWLMMVKLEALYDHLFGDSDAPSRVAVDAVTARKFADLLTAHSEQARYAALTRGVGGANGVPRHG